MRAVGRFANEHPALALGLFWVCLGAALTLKVYLGSAHLLLGAAGGTKRSVLYGQAATMAIAVMAAMLTVVSILVALPDRPRVAELRARAGWRLLQAMLLTTGGLCLAGVVTAEVGLAVDTDTAPHALWIEQWCVSSLCTAAVGTFISGLAFAALLKAVGRPADPSTGRGSGAAG